MSALANKHDLHEEVIAVRAPSRPLYTEPKCTTHEGYRFQPGSHNSSESDGSDVQEQFSEVWARSLAADLRSPLIAMWRLPTEEDLSKTGVGEMMRARERISTELQTDPNSPHLRRDHPPTHMRRTAICTRSSSSKRATTAAKFVKGLVRSLLRRKRTKARIPHYGLRRKGSHQAFVPNPTV